MGSLLRNRVFARSALILSGAAIGVGYNRNYGLAEELTDTAVESDAQLVNWSATHEMITKRLHQPETMDQLKGTLQASQLTGAKIRPLGSGLSPNGIAFDGDGVVSMGLLDKVIDLDTENKIVRVQTGIKVSQLVEFLRPYGLTLQNYASIAEQQIGGFLQAGAHGTGAQIPPVDEQIISMKIHTPGLGELELSNEKNPILFKLARVGLGSLGIVSEASIQCVEAHKLREQTFVSTAKQIRVHHEEWLRSHRHLRYMWIPYTDAVVVVFSDPADPEEEVGESLAFTEAEALSAPRMMMKTVCPDIPEEELLTMTFTQIRDELIHRNPLDVENIKKINEVEAEYWTKKEGVRVDWSDRILGFDCGGQQWVSEMAFPVGSIEKPSTADLDYIDELKELISRRQIPAPAPIEQRWTASSSSYLSPAWSANPNSIFSWVGIIMYLPPAGASEESDSARKEITKEFDMYQMATETELWDKYGAMEHWAKIESTSPLLDRKKKQIRRRVPVDMFNQARESLDPQKVFSNEAIDQIFG